MNSKIALKKTNYRPYQTARTLKMISLMPLPNNLNLFPADKWLGILLPQEAVFLLQISFPLTVFSMHGSITFTNNQE